MNGRWILGAIYTSQINTTLKNLNESTQEMKTEVINMRKELSVLKKKQSASWKVGKVTNTTI